MSLTIEEFDDYLENWRIEISRACGKNVSREKIFDALFMILGDKYSLEHPLDLWDIDIKFESGLKYLKEFDFTSFDHQFEIDLSFDRDMLFSTKAKFKAAGFVLHIHRYDQDPFPSNPHAHIVDQNIKIDLSNGNCYRSRTFIKTIKKKELLEIRKKAEALNIEVPHLNISS
ncbi:hypothetical protein J2X69_002693 [Algoriphagus sp. 4150]|uniref:hypothetical protein n=1 Tax=Algoriphagus sp. 4150 TaxID=2817756 RepID=UPI00285EC14B|nr:hypothetical protein [Algoriphagus sp. 4150]MDR7130343.1 hypothetical protein [Algoriphagus sp. 4150]